MVVTSMQSKKNASNSLPFATFVARLAADYPEFHFRYGTKFSFRFPKTITLGPEEPYWELLALHELSHAVLGHEDFNSDVERLKMEAAAWDKAKELADQYKVTIDEDFIESQLDTYRDWLHKKSRCPKCGLTRFQDVNGIYRCPRCENFI